MFCGYFWLHGDITSLDLLVVFSRVFMNGANYELKDFVLVSDPSDVIRSRDTADICQLIDFIDDGKHRLYHEF